DIYALGLVLFEMATGSRPTPEYTAVEPAGLDRIIKTCLAKDPDERWQSARDIKYQLEGIASTPAEVSPAPTRSRRGYLGWAAAAVIAVLAFAGYYRTTRPPELK